jgi:hypothetical protein
LPRSFGPGKSLRQDWQDTMSGRLSLKKLPDQPPIALLTFLGTDLSKWLESWNDPSTTENWGLCRYFVGKVVQRAANVFAGRGMSCEHIRRHLWIGQHHAAQADEVRSAVAQHTLTDVGQPFLQSTNILSQPWSNADGATSTGPWQQSDEPRRLADILAVEGRKNRWSLDVRVIVAAPAGVQTD